MKTLQFTRTLILLSVASAFFALSGCKPKSNLTMDQQLADFIRKHDSVVIPLAKEANLASWSSSISGKPEDFAKTAALQLKLTKVYANKDAFATLKKIKESGEVKDTLLKREMDLLYNAYLGAQVDTNKLKAIIDLQSQIEQKYNNFRAEIGGKKVSDNEIEETLRNSVKSDALKEAWTAHKKIGPVVSDDVKKLVKMRNDMAKELGFNNFHEMSLKLSEQDPQQIETLFNELDSLTRGTFIKLKGEIDDYFAARYKVKKEDLMPWHYQNRFFQEAPKIYKADLDKYYAGKDLVKITEDFYKSIGLDITDMVAKSDLFEKPGKNQHAFCTDIDREGDIRVLCNVKPDSKWMNTLMHEFGHAVYSKYIDRTMPYTLRTEAHTFTTEAIANWGGRLSSNPQWMKDMLGISDAEKAKIADDSWKTTRLEMMVFSRWAQVMYRFEKAMYENPDQDLNKLWWDMVEKYQMLKKPADRNEPDWASKIHIALYPCYYHNYLLGDLLSFQLQYYMATNILKNNDLKSVSFVGKPEVGQYLKDKVFSVGSKYYWDDMIEKATGEKLTAKYYAKMFAD